MPKRLSLILVSIVAAATPVRAADFSDDLEGLRSALRIWRHSDAKLEQSLDPLKGPLEFRLSEQAAPWAGNYFPMKDGGIASRWQQPVQPQDVLNQPANAQHFRDMSAAQVAKLSPAEKYDLFLGNYDLPVTKFELQNRGPLRDMKVEDWEGFCNGVRCAGINLNEPQHQVIVVNKDGVRITFEPADLKALAGASYFYVEHYAQAGSPSDDTQRAGDQPNAAVFDAILRNFLAEKQKAFVIDSHLGAEIWNESVVGYRRELGPLQDVSDEEKRSNRWAVKKIEVTGYLETLGELDIQASNRTQTKKLVADGSILSRVPIHYVLYLDKNGLARDGVWHNGRGTRGVDFVWFGGGRGADHVMRPGATFRESLNFSKLKKLFSLSQKMSCSRVLLAP